MAARPEPQPERPEPLPLSERQLRVLRQISHGLRFADIARETGSTPQAVKDVAREARVKLAAKTNCHLVGIALRRGLIQ